MRVIVSNQDPRPATAMATSAPPYFATGEVDGWDGDVIFVSRLPKAQRESVAFRLDDGAFAGGPDLAYVDYWLVDRERRSPSHWRSFTPRSPACVPSFLLITARLFSFVANSRRRARFSGFRSTLRSSQSRMRQCHSSLLPRMPNNAGRALAGNRRRERGASGER